MHKDAYRCKGAIITGGRRCYFNVQPGSEYCPGHQKEPAEGCDMLALGRYQGMHGIDYPCGRDGDLERVFEPADYHFSGGTPVPMTEADVRSRIARVDAALAELDAYGGSGRRKKRPGGPEREET